MELERRSSSRVWRVGQEEDPLTVRLWRVIDEWAREFADHPEGYDTGYPDAGWVDLNQEHHLVLANRLNQFFQAEMKRNYGSPN